MSRVAARRNRSRALAAGLTAGLALVAACSTEDIVGPETQPNPPVASIAPHVGVEQPGFTFLAPIGDLQFSPSNGDIDGALHSQLRVEICEWTGSACRLPLTRTFAAGDGLALADGPFRDAYWALWPVTRRNSDLGKQYRIRVLAGQTELGRADVKVVRWLEILFDGEPLSGSGKVALGSVVPIRFHVAKGTLATVGAGGGTVSLAEGQVSLAVPAGAVTGPTQMSAVPATTLPAGGPPVVPGTAWDFGPDGITFAAPVTMTIRYDPAALLPGMVESELRIHKLVDGSYVQQNAGVVDPVARTVSAQVDGFSIYVVVPRVPGREEDITAPVVTGVEVFDPVTGTWGSSATPDASAADVTLRLRAAVQDNIAGVNRVTFIVAGPSERVPARVCQVFGVPPVSGSDTQGVWECSLVLPQYSEAGSWRLSAVTASDRVGNGVGYNSTPTSADLCIRPAGTVCLSGLPTISLIANPSDVTPPVVADPIMVSQDVVPRAFGNSVTIDVAGGPRNVIVTIPFSDDLSGGTGSSSVRFQPAAGGGPFVHSISCIPEGTLIGTLTCVVFFPQLAPGGTYLIGALTARDRVGNSVSFLQSAGGLCQVGGGPCLATGPTVEVISIGDTQPPSLTGLAFSVNGGMVTSTLQVTDDLAGVAYGTVIYRSATSAQSLACPSGPTGGTPTAATIECTATFSELAALGTWYVTVTVGDAAGNGRSYTRRAADGFLCYTDPATQLPVCQDFGDTDLILQ